MVMHIERRRAGFKFKSAEGGRDQLRRMHQHHGMITRLKWARYFTGPDVGRVGRAAEAVHLSVSVIHSFMATNRERSRRIGIHTQERKC